MAKLTLKDLDITGKKVLMRVDFNVPLDNDLNVVDATRIKATLPSIRYVLDHGGALILMSHLGRPKGIVNEDLSLKPCVEVLEALLKKSVKMAPKACGEKVLSLANHLRTGEVLLLENLRFHRAEQHPEEDPSFAKELAQLGDLYVNDAFGTAHRKHSSTYTIAKYFPQKAAAGFLLEKEIHFLGETLIHPERPFVAVIGGAKISSKIGVLRTLVDKVDSLLIGGAMAFTFLKAKEIPVGSSLVEEDFVPIARQILETKQEALYLPTDAVIGKQCSANTVSSLVSLEQGIPEGYQGLDIGPETIKIFDSILSLAKTIVWNGPMGVYEFPHFAKGTETLAKKIGQTDATTILGGGDLVAAVNKVGVANEMTHISTGGGASLEYLEHGTLPAIEVLSDRK